MVMNLFDYNFFKYKVKLIIKHKIIKAEYKTKSNLSDKISKDLKKKGMKFVGSITIYSYLEAIGIIDNHTKDCFKY